MKKIDWQNHNGYFTGTVAPMQRMTPELLEFYSSPDVIKIRANCPSAVVMQFKSNTENLRISMEFGGQARQIFSADIFVDGSLTTIDGAGTHDLALPEGEKSIVIHLPHLVEIPELVVEVDDNATVATIENTLPKLVLCGDSIMQGMTCSSPSKALGAIAAKKLNMTLHNLSVGGAVMQPIPVAEAVKLNGEITVVGFGINDANKVTDTAVFRERTRQVLTILSQASGKAFIVTPIPALVDAEKRREIYSSIIREEHQAFPQVKLIEGTTLLEACEEYFVDGVHPNDQGMMIYGSNLTSAIKAEL